MLPWIFFTAAAAILLALGVAALASVLQHYASSPVASTEDDFERDRWQEPVSTLGEEERNGFLTLWQSIRRRFEDDPNTSVVYADLLMSDLVEGDGSRRNSDHALGDGDWKQNYRVAHEIAVRSKQGNTDRSELHHAMGLYSVLFQQLLGGSKP